MASLQLASAVMLVPLGAAADMSVHSTLDCPSSPKMKMSHTLFAKKYKEAAGDAADAFVGSSNSLSVNPITVCSIRRAESRSFCNIPKIRLADHHALCLHTARQHSEVPECQTKHSFLSLSDKC